MTVRHSSVNKAAAEAGLSQPAVTQAVAKLEQEFGCRLFDRSSTGVFPTESGVLLVARVDRAFEFLSDAGKILATAREGNSQGLALERYVSTSQLKAIVALARHGSLAAAGRELGVSSPAVHRAASQLEDIAGVTLFNRTAYGVSLTKHARVLARAATLAFHEIELGLQEVMSLQGRTIGRITIGSLPLAQSYIVPAALQVLSEKFPGVIISVVDGSYAVLTEGLRNGDIDIMIGALRESQHEDDLEQEILFDDKLSILARRGHPLHRNPYIIIADLAHYKWIVARQGSPTREMFKRIFANRLDQVSDGIIETGSFSVIRELLRTTDRLALISPAQAFREIAEGTLLPIRFRLEEGPRPIGLTLRKGYKPTEILNELIGALKVAAATPKALPLSTLSIFDEDFIASPTDGRKE
jgi:Transcriptional regulator